MDTDLKDKNISFWNMLGGGFSNVVFSFLILFAMDMTWKEFFLNISIPKDKALLYLGITFLLTAIPCYLIDQQPFMKEVNNSGFNRQLFSFSIPKLAIIYLVLCSTEELLFRVAIQGSISKFINVPFAIGIVSIVFALMHIRYVKHWQLVISSIWVSVVWGALYALTGSWIMVSLTHFAHNFILSYLVIKER